MIGRGHLDVKVAVPCDADGRPVSDTAIFHEKSGLIEDRAGHRIAWTGSLNETAAGWRRNWESINVYRSWGPEPERVAAEERTFARLWANRSPRAIVLDVPDAARQDLLRFLPPDLPARLKAKPPADAPDTEVEPEPSEPPEPAPPLALDDRRRLVWTFIQRAPALPDGGRAGRRGHGRGLALAAPASGLRAAVRALAAEAPDRRRGGPRQDHPGGPAAAAGVARRPRQADSRPRAQGAAEAVADRAAREVQPELADLRRAQAEPLPGARPPRAPRARGRSAALARGTGRDRVEPSGAAKGPRRRPARRRAVGPDRPRRGAPRSPTRGPAARRRAARTRCSS